MKSVMMIALLKSPERMTLLKNLMMKIVPENRRRSPRSKSLLRR